MAINSARLKVIASRYTDEEDAALEKLLTEIIAADTKEFKDENVTTAEALQRYLALLGS